MTTLNTMEKTSALSRTKREKKIRKEMGGLNDLLLKAVDETLNHIFKEAGAKVIYNYLENKCHLRREEIVEKPDVFSVSLKRLLVSAAPLVEKMILENLYSKLELKFEEREGYEFSDYIMELKES